MTWDGFGPLSRLASADEFLAKTCIHLEYQVGLISLGCNWGQLIIFKKSTCLMKAVAGVSSGIFKLMITAKWSPASFVPGRFLKGDSVGDFHVRVKT